MERNVPFVFFGRVQSMALSDFSSFLDEHEGRIAVGGVPEGYDAMALAVLLDKGRDVLHIARDDNRMLRLIEALRFFAPKAEILAFPGWDCVPYDRASPSADIVIRRIDTMSRLAQPRAPDAPPRIVICTIISALQRVPKIKTFERAVFSAKVGEPLDMKALQSFLDRNGYTRADTVMEAGEYARRGGIFDIYPSGARQPVRIDLFGDDIERIRLFDPISQRTSGESPDFRLVPASEVIMDFSSTLRFRSRYRELFGPVTHSDPLYEAVSAGQKISGMEHWLPLFNDGMDTIFDYAPEAIITQDHHVEEAKMARLEAIEEYYAAREAMMEKGFTDTGAIYRPVPPELAFMSDGEMRRVGMVRSTLAFSPFASGRSGGMGSSFDLAAKVARNFADIRKDPEASLFQAIYEHVKSEMASGRRVVLAAWSPGSMERLGALINEKGQENAIKSVNNWEEAQALPPNMAALTVLPIEHGFSSAELSLLSEQDMLGDRLVRMRRRSKRSAAKLLFEAQSLNEGDIVVHIEHGIGSYQGLVTLEVAGAPHDCLRILYDGGDKLFVPVENIDALSRYGSENNDVALDRLGSAAWQGRKAKLKKRVHDMAEQLVAVAAARLTKTSEKMVPPEGLYDEFCARFPYVETDDQLNAIEDCIDDLASGRPMDRLICGDVGFGKTEVALRTAFIAAMSGRQVAVVVTTTLLARQHFHTFTERFAGLPIRVEQISRLVKPSKAAAVRKGLKEGKVDIVVGTHALLSKSVEFANLGLLIVDEEQHFGVSHKERLKQLRVDVNVLTLTATPIPRTLQLALTGVRDLSIIATPPVDRLSVRTFVLPFDGLVVREAITRELYRGGQVFYVCPRLADIYRVLDRLRDLTSELRIAVVHGQMDVDRLEETMTAFADGAYDVLLSTNIIESGLDMPRVNTIFIHRADMFGLSQLYQLRGRVGRAKARGYAYMLLPTGQALTKTAERRLQVMQTLDSLGAGFALASHDLDIRGAGNLLGDEQSGHIREVGVELYQSMIEEAVAEARGEDSAALLENEWSPQIGLGTAVLIPETYVTDLSVRLSLYRRIGALKDRGELDGLAAEMVDRFGPLPPEVVNLLDVMSIKASCRLAGIEKIDAGPKGAVLSFRNNLFANPAGLVEFISQQSGTVTLRPDHKLVMARNWVEPEARLKGARILVETLAQIALGEKAQMTVEKPAPAPVKKPLPKSKRIIRR